MPTTAAGREFLASNAKVEGVVVLPSGLQYKILQAANPGSKSPLPDTRCECHYRGTLVDGTEFDSSHRRGTPTTFAPSQVIKGWKEALQLMAEGDKWMLYLPSELAYGDAMRGQHITPGAVLIFELEMLRVLGEVGAKTAVVHTAESRAALSKPAGGPPPPHAASGKRVQVIGLEAKPEFNGQLGIVTSWDEARQRAGVRLDSGASFALKPANLWPSAETADEDAVMAPPAEQPKAAAVEAAPAVEAKEAKRAAAVAQAEREAAAMAAEENAAAVKAAAEAMAAAEQALSTIPMPLPRAVAPVPPPPVGAASALPPPPPECTGTPVDEVPREAWCTGMHEISGGFIRAPGKEPGAQAVVFADGGRSIVTRTYEGDVEKCGVYSVASGAAIRCLAGHSDVVTALAVDGDTLASAAADGTCRLWELASGRSFAIAAVGEAVCGVGLRGDNLITGDMGRNAILWYVDEPVRAHDAQHDAEAPAQSHAPAPRAAELSRVGTQEHAGTVFCAGLTADGAACSVGCYQTDLKLWGGGCETLVEVTLPAAAGYAMVVEGAPCAALVAPRSSRRGHHAASVPRGVSPGGCHAGGCPPGGVTPRAARARVPRCPCLSARAPLGR